jgi:hypothetical protein
VNAPVFSQTGAQPCQERGIPGSATSWGAQAMPSPIAILPQPEIPARELRGEIIRLSCRRSVLCQHLQ